jgi:glycosyltransferase involved in cell wall biosynthesis
MRVLLVNAFDSAGGAARAAYRLHQALLTQGVDSQMLVQSKSSDDYTVLGPSTKFQKASIKVRKFLDSVPLRRYKGRVQTYFSPGWLPFSAVVDRINALEPDVVHLHWIGEGMIRIEDLVKIKAPIVWSLHDNWGFTGGCHVMWQCTRYQQTCGTCPQLGGNRENDLSRSVFHRKQKTYAKLPNMRIVALSNWMAECAKKSSLFKDHTVCCLPNPINTQTFAPFDKNQARALLQLPTDKKLIAFGAIRATDDINKGYHELSEALRYVSEDVELVVFGSGRPKQAQGFKQKSHYLGHIHDDVSLRVLYSAVDVVVVPSLQENLSNVIMESLACGTPVVGFDVGGNRDLIDHRVNGYVAKPSDIRDLSAGIGWILDCPEYQMLCQNARVNVMHSFDTSVVAKKYIELYVDVVR